MADPFERMIMSEAFAELLARTTENVVALTKIGSDLGDLTVRNLRLAGRTDIARLGRSLARVDDKLESVLQEVESLRDEVASLRDELASTRVASGPAGEVASQGDGR